MDRHNSHQSQPVLYIENLRTGGTGNHRSRHTVSDWLVENDSNFHRHYSYTFHPNTRQPGGSCRRHSEQRNNGEGLPSTFPSRIHNRSHSYHRDLSKKNIFAPPHSNPQSNRREQDMGPHWAPRVCHTSHRCSAWKRKPRDRFPYRAHLDPVEGRTDVPDCNNHSRIENGPDKAQSRVGRHCYYLLSSRCQ